MGAHGKERGGSSIALALVPLATMYTLTRSLSNRLCYYLTLVHVVVLTSPNNIIIVVLSSSSYTHNTPITMGQSTTQSPVLYRQTNPPCPGLPPVHFFSHGSTMMLGEESTSADYWKQAGDEALANNIKGVIMMGAHWDATGTEIQVAMNPKPGKSPVAYVHPSKYVNYHLNADLPTGEKCMKLLKDEGFNVTPHDSFEWIHDTYLILIRMFPTKCPPTTIISMNARFDPHFHMRVGSTLRPLRSQGYLIIGTGGAVHNLYRNQWAPMLKYRDNFAQEAPPEGWALEFRQSVEDVMKNNRGPNLRRAVTRLMKHPQYRDAHATDDHFMAACFVSGAAGDWEDLEEKAGELKAETWELTNMCNSQFTIGEWKSGGKAVAAH